MNKAEEKPKIIKWLYITASEMDIEVVAVADSKQEAEEYAYKDLMDNWSRYVDEAGPPRPTNYSEFREWYSERKFWVDFEFENFTFSIVSIKI